MKCEYILRKFDNAIFNEDVLYNIGYPGRTELGSVNVQVIADGLFKIKVILQPKCVHSVVNAAQFIVPAVQKKIFDEIKFDLYTQAEIYSYMEWETKYPGGSNTVDIESIIAYRVKNDEESAGYTSSCKVEIKPLNKCPSFLDIGNSILM